MASKKYLILLITVFTFIGCVKPNSKTNNVYRIELARSGAWYDPGAAMSVDSTLTFSYYGVLANSKQEYYTGKVNIAFWDTLKQRLEKTRYKNVKPTDSRHISDVNQYELLVYWKNHHKRIVRIDSGEPDSVMQFITWLNSTYKTVRLKKTKPVTFNTTYQTLPIVEGVKEATFPPPKK